MVVVSLERRPKLTQIIDLNSGVDILPKKKYKNLELVKLLSISNEENLKNPCELADETMFKEQYELRFGKPKEKEHKESH